MEFDGNGEYFSLSSKVFSEFFFRLSENLVLLREYLLFIFGLNLLYFGYLFSGIRQI